MKKALRTIFFLALAPVVAFGQTVSSQGFVIVDNVLVENTEVRVLAGSPNDLDTDTLEVVMTDVSGYYYILADLPEGQDAAFLETDACPGLHFPLTLAGNDSINIICSDSPLDNSGLFIAAFPADADNMLWYFINNFSIDVESYTWLIDGITYSTAEAGHTFGASGVYDIMLTVVLTSGETLVSNLEIYVGNDFPLNCSALFFAMQDTTVDNSVYFANGSLGSNLTYSWDFGDGNTSTEQYPSHNYGDATVMYDVCLTISGDDCDDTYCLEVSGQLDGSGLIVNEKNPTLNLAKADGFNFVVLPLQGGISGQSDLEKQAPLSVYPNPSAGTITLQMNLENGGNGMVKVTDLTGKTVLEQNIATVNSLNTVSINMNELTDGVYLIQYLGKQNSKVQKLILQR